MRKESVIKYVDKKIRKFIDDDKLSIDSTIFKLKELKVKFEGKTSNIGTNYHLILSDFLKKRIDDMEFMKVLSIKSRIMSNSKLFDMIILKDKLVQDKEKNN